MKALVWFWLIDETLSANLVYQSDYEIGSTTPSDEAMAKIMMMVERRTLQVLVEVLVGMMSFGTPSKRMRSECWSFFFSSLFGACQRRKLEERGQQLF